jgi:hypothetical protein
MSLDHGAIAATPTMIGVGGPRRAGEAPGRAESQIETQVSLLRRLNVELLDECVALRERLCSVVLQAKKDPEPTSGPVVAMPLAPLAALLSDVAVSTNTAILILRELRSSIQL